MLGNACQEGMFTNDDYIMRKRSKSILCTPITYKGKLVGILYLENNITTNAITRDRLELLHILSSQIAVSIENAKLYKMAITDGLTELITHQYFMYTLEKEIARSERYKKVFSLIMFDIDHFKNVNDNYGHPAGDEILKNIGKIVKKTYAWRTLSPATGERNLPSFCPKQPLKTH